MRLPDARLCLDCDEIHDAMHCPICASESFAFITRWIPTPEKRARPASPAPADSETAETVAAYRALLAAKREPRTMAGRLLRGGAMGLALLGAAGWILQRDPKEKND